MTATRPDAPEAEDLGPDFWKNSRIVAPRRKTSIHLRVDADVVEWFKAHGRGRLTRMNVVPRAYVNAHSRG